MFIKVKYFLEIIPAIIGSVIGGFIDSKYAKYKGDHFIKLMFVTVGGFLGFKLLFGIY